MADWDKDFPVPGAPAPASAPRLRVGFADPEQHRVVVTLLHPLALDGGERIDAFTIRRITACEMLLIVEHPDAPADDSQLIRHVVAAMCGWPIEVLDALSPDDAGRVAAAAIPFMPAGLVVALERTLAAAETAADAA